MAQVEHLQDGGAIVTLEDPAVWTPFDVFTWVAFGERRSGADHLLPHVEWSRNWIHWPPQNLAQAFHEIWSGVPWQPDPDSYESGWADNDRVWARRVMEQTGASARELAWVLDADIERYRWNEARYQNAKSTVIAAIREGRLPVWARKAHGRGSPNYAAEHELLTPRWFTQNGLREVNEAAWVDAPGNYKGPWWDEVHFDADKVQAIWPAPPSSAGVASLPQPFPVADHIEPWQAVCWRAFGTLVAPPHVSHHRSFDGGDTRFPDEGEARHAARRDEHRRFDAAERKLLDLLSSGRVKAVGQSPARAASGSRLHHHAPTHVDIPANAFLNRQIAFALNGELIPRLDLLARSFPPLELRGSDANPGFPLYHDVLIEAAGLREAWGIVPASQPEDPSMDVLIPTPSKRKHTGWDLRVADVPLVKEMRRMIEAGEATSATNAARAIVKQAEGPGNPGSKVARLVKRYGET